MVIIFKVLRGLNKIRNLNRDGKNRNNSWTKPGVILETLESSKTEPHKALFFNKFSIIFLSLI